MAQNTANVRKRSAGSLWTAPTGTAAPTGHSSVLAAAFVDLGYASDDGVEEERDRSLDEIRAIGGVLVRTVVTDSSLTYAFTLLETRKESIELYYGSTITLVPPTTSVSGLVDVNPSQTGGTKSFVFDFTDGVEIKRIYIATGEVTEVEPLTMGGEDADMFGLTIAAYPSSAGICAKIWDTTLKV